MNILSKSNKNLNGYKNGYENEDELERELNLLEKNKAIIDVNLSEEQELIIESKSNIVVDAVAGSGKTTTILHMGLKYPNSNIIQIACSSFKSFMYKSYFG